MRSWVLSGSWVPFFRYAKYNPFGIIYIFSSSPHKKTMVTVNKLTANYEYSRNGENLLLPIQLQLSRKPKALLQFYCIFRIYIKFWTFWNKIRLITIKNIFYDKMDVKLFYFDVAICRGVLRTLSNIYDEAVRVKLLYIFVKSSVTEVW